jgi:oxygen-independent coproporphyrinogen-3 oxidase
MTASPFPPVDQTLVQRYDVPAPRYTSYPTAPIWTPTVGPAEFAEALRTAGARTAEPLSIYVHIPFCKERCAFCGCNVVIARSQSTADHYLDAVDREIARAAELLGDRRTVSQLHWGGGTPTFLDEAQIQRLWTSIFSRFRLAPNAEVAIEVDPVVTRRSQVELLSKLGFNRMSLGVQDFDHEIQKTIDRVQSFDETRSLLEHARSLGFAGINTDIIYGLPGQTPASWARTLELIVKMRPDRLAVYGFAYVPDLKTNQKRLPLSSIPTGAAKLHLFRLAYEALLGAGYEPIGMDHFALPEDELAQARQRRSLTRNFQGYTVGAAPDVVAFGVSSISDVGGMFAQNAHQLAKYEAAALQGELATERGMRLTEDDKRRRGVITQLMCNFWVDLGPDAAREFAPELEKLRVHQQEGLLELKGNEIELTPLGRIFVRNVASVFDAYLTPGQGRFSRAV